MPEGLRQRAVRTVAPSYTLGSQARIERSDGRILLVKPAYRWRWGMPGGLLDPGEAPEEAIRREALEETGLAIEVIGDPVVLVETTMQRVNFIYNARPVGGADPDAIRPQASEILEIGWFEPDQLPETIPDMSQELFIRQRAPKDGPSVVVTGAMPDDRPPDTEA